MIQIYNDSKNSEEHVCKCCRKPYVIITIYLILFLLEWVDDWVV